MRSYGTLSCEFWRSAESRALSAEAVAMYCYAATCEHQTIIGACYLPPMYVAGDRGISAEKAQAALDELNAVGLIRYDGAASWLWCCHHLHFFPTVGPKQCAAALEQARRIPTTCTWHGEFLRRYGKMIGVEANAIPIEPDRVSDRVSERVSDRVSNAENREQEQRTGAEFKSMKVPSVLSCPTRKKTLVSDTPAATKPENQKTEKSAGKDATAEEALHQEAIALIDYLNSSLRAHHARLWYRPTARNLEPISVALAQGMTVSECKRQIDEDVRRRHASSVAKFLLKPAVIFTPTSILPHRDLSSMPAAGNA